MAIGMGSRRRISNKGRFSPHRRHPFRNRAAGVAETQKPIVAPALDVIRAQPHA